MADAHGTLEAVEEAIGYRFADRDLLQRALTHSSYAAEHDVESYERLEFLGDAVLELAVTEHIYRSLEDAPEGRMTRIRAGIVDELTLADACQRINLQEAVRLGVGEDRNGGRTRPSIRSDVVESVLGAVYLDGGVTAAFGVVQTLVGGAMEDRVALGEVVDFRSSLQERLARSGKVVRFEYERSGPDHETVYTASASIDGEVVASGTGGSKKAAANDASRAAMESLDS